MENLLKIEKKNTENSLKLKNRKNQQKFEKRLEEEEKKSTFRAFALQANKPFAGKFAKDWKKSLKIVSFDLRLFEEIGGNVQKKNKIDRRKQKKHF